MPTIIINYILPIIITNQPIEEMVKIGIIYPHTLIIYVWGVYINQLIFVVYSSRIHIESPTIQSIVKHSIVRFANKSPKMNVKRSIPCFFIAE